MRPGVVTKEENVDREEERTQGQACGVQCSVLARKKRSPNGVKTQVGDEMQREETWWMG